LTVVGINGEFINISTYGTSIERWKGVRTTMIWFIWIFAQEFFAPGPCSPFQ
jgi:hypothetical protein